MSLTDSPHCDDLKEALRECWEDWGLTVVSFAFVVVLCFAVWFAFSYCEARAFEAATGEPVSVWQAMFLDLRVQESVR